MSRVALAGICGVFVFAPVGLIILAAALVLHVAPSDYLFWAVLILWACSAAAWTGVARFVAPHLDPRR